MEHHGLSSAEPFSTDWTAAGLGVVIRIEMSVQSLREGSSPVTEVTLLVVLVIPCGPPTLGILGTAYHKAYRY